MMLTAFPTARRRVSRRSAFTLIEVLVVVAILVILAGIATVALFRNIEDAKKTKAQLQAKTIATAIESYMASPANPMQQPPSSLEELLQPATGGTSYLKNGQQDLIDPWGNMYQVKQITGGDGNVDYLVFTVAKDGTPISQYGQGAQLSRINN